MQTSSKFYFEKVRISKIKIFISFKMGKEELDFQLNPAKGFGGLGLLTNLGGSLMDISNTPLKFKKFEMEYKFLTLE
jgi:hypothetical protein